MYKGFTPILSTRFFVLFRLLEMGVDKMGTYHTRLVFGALYGGHPLVIDTKTNGTVATY